MKNRKRRVELLSFYDHVGISRHLEKMAAKGWMLEKITNLGWVYRRIEPKQLHFTVSYYSKASEFDPEPTEDQKTFYDFCAHTGWQLACSSAQLQIFYNERENPTPIETDAKLEVQAIPSVFRLRVSRTCDNLPCGIDLLFRLVSQSKSCCGIWRVFENTSYCNISKNYHSSYPAWGIALDHQLHYTW